MKNKNTFKRRDFIKVAAGTGITAGLSATGAHATKPAIMKRRIKRDFIKVGMVGLGPYSHAMAYTEAINDISFPPRTNMKVVAVWGKEDNYMSSLRGTEEWKKKRVNSLSSYMSIDTFTHRLGVEHVVQHPEDMVKLVDAVFITDPEDSLNLARPFLLEGKPVFINRPFAWTLKEARDIIRLAQENECALVGGSCVPWMNEFQVAASRINPQEVQHYYVDGSTANFCSYMPHILETAQKLVGGKVVACSTYGMCWPADEDPISIPPVMTHLKHEMILEDREPVIGVASTWFGQPYRNWAKVHCDKDVVEQAVYWEGTRGPHHDEHIWLPFLRVIDRTFETGVWHEDEDYLLNKVATMLMAHKSGVEGGRPVGIDEIENYSLPRFETEKA